MSTEREEVVFVEGEPERLVESPIGFHYDAEGRLVITYEPSWEDVALGYRKQEPVSEPQGELPITTWAKSVNAAVAACAVTNGDSR